MRFRTKNRVSIEKMFILLATNHWDLFYSMYPLEAMNHTLKKNQQNKRGIFKLNWLKLILQ